MRGFMLLVLITMVAVVWIVMIGQNSITRQPAENLQQRAERICAVEHTGKQDRKDCVYKMLLQAAFERSVEQHKEAVRSVSR